MQKVFKDSTDCVGVFTSSVDIVHMASLSGQVEGRISFVEQCTLLCCERALMVLLGMFFVGSYVHRVTSESGSFIKP